MVSSVLGEDPRLASLVDGSGTRFDGPPWGVAWRERKTFESPRRAFNVEKRHERWIVREGSAQRVELRSQAPSLLGRRFGHGVERAIVLLWRLPTISKEALAALGLHAHAPSEDTPMLPFVTSPYYMPVEVDELSGRSDWMMRPVRRREELHLRKDPPCRLLTTRRCQRGCRWRSISSMSTTPGVARRRARGGG